MARQTVTKNTIKRLESHIAQKNDITKRVRKDQKFLSKISTMNQEKKRKPRVLNPEDVRKRKERRKTRQKRRRRSLSASKGEDSEGSSDGAGILHWWASAKSFGDRFSPGNMKRTQDLAEKFSFDEKALFEITNNGERKKMGRVGQLVYLKREHHELLGTQFQQDDSGRLWVLVVFFKGSVSFSYRDQDAIRAACGNTFSDMEVIVSFFENEAERKACGAMCMTQIIVKVVKNEAITSGSLIYEPV
ncbi:MAG: hypothetical protein ACTSUE_10305 [Promethearchaeota archaeon]